MSNRPPDGQRVSVVMVTCGRPALLERAIESVRQQTTPDWELLLVHDKLVRQG